MALMLQARAVGPSLPALGTGRYRLIERIGAGSFADVYLATSLESAERFAIKHATTEVGKRVLGWEEENLRRMVECPFVLPMRDYWIEADGSACLVTPYLDGGDLKHFVRARGGLPMDESLAILHRAVLAMIHAHALRPPLVHRDIKPDNILGRIEADGGLTWLLADWGLAESWFGEHAPRFSGTSRYTAPEVWKKRRYLVSDVYSLGMTLYFMLFGQPAYNGESLKVARGQRSPEPVVIPEGCPEPLRELLTGMLAKNHVKRWPLARVLERLEERRTGLALLENSTPPQSWTARYRGFAMAFVWIEPGVFHMGMAEAGDAHPDRLLQPSDKRATPRHRVRVDGFWMARFPVTRGQFRFFLRDSGYKTSADRDGWANPYIPESGRFERRDGSNWERPGFSQTDDHPVVNVSHEDAMAFAEWLSWRCHRLVRLPTEAEWERACRADGESRYAGGDEITPDEANYARMRGGTVPVGSHPPNRFGLHDMHGQVHEWVRDWFLADFYTRSPEINPYCDAAESGERVLRGGSWHASEGRIRSAARDRYHPGRSDGDIGFRLSALAYPWEGRWGT
ncbi:Hercynine oxygenase [Candidatus Magnetaquicoccaceae bacterium FCR-1]|uniref:Hercynine oxygenase n=1 Tax=Candidatus Magnetaquiglobus chichijimensis TaxID=3141448 RepID=A0ABQ0CD08_9PROT